MFLTLILLGWFGLTVPDPTRTPQTTPTKLPSAEALARQACAQAVAADPLVCGIAQCGQFADLCPQEKKP